MSGTLFLCRVCFPNPGEVKTLAIPVRACDYCGGLCSNCESPGLPPGDLVNASDAPPPHALTRAEVEALILPPEPPPPPPGPYRIPESEQCRACVDVCGGHCKLKLGHDGGEHVCDPDEDTGVALTRLGRATGWARKHFDFGYAKAWEPEPMVVRRVPPGDDEPEPDLGRVDP